MKEPWENVSLSVQHAPVLCHPIQTCSLAYIAAWGEGERGSSKGEREKTADDRVIKAELHPPHRAGRQATVHPSRLLLMTWVSKNLRLLSHPVRIRVTAIMLVTRLKRRRCNQFLLQQSHTLRRRTLRCRPSLRCVAPAT